MGFHLYEEQKPKKLHHVINWIVDVIAVAVFAVYTVYAFGTRVPVNGGSMEPVLSSGDVVLLNRLAYDLGKPERFDLAVFERPGSGMNIKRVIGLPGETVQIADGKIYIDGEVLDMAAVSAAGSAAVTPAGAAEYPIELGSDEYFLLGDNRESSEDSRFSTIGNIKREQILGKVWLRFLPLSKFGPLR